MLKFSCLALACGALLGAPAAHAGRFTFTILDVPGQLDTYALGLNDRGEVVGYSDSSAGQANFIWSNGVFSHAPAYGGNSVTQLNAINDRGTAVGFSVGAYGSYDTAIGYAYDVHTGVTTPIPVVPGYTMFPTGINATGTVAGNAYIFDGRRYESYGFMAHGSTAKLLAPPNGKRSTLVSAINDAGRVVGDYGAYRNLGFTGLGRAYAAVNPPGSTGTAVTFVSPGGIVGGLYYDASYGTHGFTWDGSTYKVYDGAGESAPATVGVGPQGQVFGNTSIYAANSGPGSGFVVVGGKTYPIAVSSDPATATVITAVNANGDLVGTYRDANAITHGFIATCPPRHSPCTR
jgi:hypothetical protein